MSDARSSLSRIVSGSAPYWAGEFAIGERYFSDGSRTFETDAEWMELQMFKEWAGSGVYGRGDVTVLNLVKDSAERLGRVDTSVPVAELERVKGHLQFATDELDHYILLARAYQHVSNGQNKSIQDMCHIDEGKKMIEMRQNYRDRPHGDVTVELTEGGGLGLYYGIRQAFKSKPDLSPLDRCILDFAEATISDETEHMAGRFLKAMELDISDEDWGVVDENLRDLFAQKLRERNQQFGSIFGDDELERMGTDVDSGRRYVKVNLGFLAERLGIA